ncbi:MAG: Sua5/YciO/YrdC/YwlC family protein, partial [Thermoplasmatota archaeon]
RLAPGARIFGLAPDTNFNNAFRSAARRALMQALYQWQLSGYPWQDVYQQFAAGEDFGKGSSREHAAAALKELGIKAVFAKSIAPIMKRNLINIGIFVYEDPDLPDACSDKDAVRVTTNSIENKKKGWKSELKPLPAFMERILESGGIMPILLRNGGLSSFARPIQEEDEVKEVGGMKIFQAYDKYVDTVVEQLERGEVLCGPFDTTYGLFASIRRPDAVKKIYKLKKRSDKMPLTLIVPRRKFGHYAEIPDRISDLLETKLKGPISIILPKKKNVVPDYVTSGLPTVSLADGENLFMRMVMDKVELCGTSANISGMPPPSTLAGALSQLGDELNLVVDGGPTLYRKGHTVLDLASDPPKLIRSGPYETKKILELFPEMLGDRIESLPEELVDGNSVIDLSPEVDITATSRGD